MPRLALAALLATATPAMAQAPPPLCEPIVDPDFPREVDVAFPDKIVRLVGHFHPGRANLDAFEHYLDRILDAPQSFSPVEAMAIRRRVRKFVDDNAEPIQHWLEDSKRLRDLAGHVRTVFIEYGPESFAKIEEHHRSRFERGRELLPLLGFSPAQVQKILTIALTPAYLLKNTSHEGSPLVATAEGSPFENRAIERAVCPPQTNEMRASSAYGRTMLLDEIFKRLQSRLVERGLATVGGATRHLHNGLGAAAARAKESKASDDDLVDAFVATSSLPYDETDLADIRQAIGLRPWRDWSMSEILRRLPEDIREYRGCDGRNQTIARTLERTSGNSVIFMGASHLAPVGAFLVRACRRAIGAR